MWPLVRIQSPRQNIFPEASAVKQGLFLLLSIGPFEAFVPVFTLVYTGLCKQPKGYGRRYFSYLFQKQDPRQRRAPAHVAHYERPQTDDEEFMQAQTAKTVIPICK